MKKVFHTIGGFIELGYIVWGSIVKDMTMIIAGAFLFMIGILD